jgi:KaiC/GvpD/RAD55 family RecA-like ATPase
MTPILDLALKYSDLGWQSFQLRPRDKTPVVKWADVATAEKNMLIGWWDVNPAANIGIACGKRSGIVVLDVDKDKGGYESLAELQTRYGKLPETPVCRTGSGGEHIYFNYPDNATIRNSAGKLGPGLDIRGDGGYVVAPPSIHPNGNRYEWVVLPTKVEFAPMPEWMIELLHEKQAVITEQVQGGKIINGYRNDTLARLAGSMRRKGFDSDAIFAALKTHNIKHCNPPLEEGEVYQIAESIGRYEPQEKVTAPAPLPDAWDVIDVLEADIIERQKNPRDVWGIHYAWDYLSRLTGGKEPGEFIILAGEPGVGKSWWAHQDALFAAIGMKGIPTTPTLIWSGEMKRKQVFRRFFEMLGVSKRAMKSGSMTAEDWQFFNEAKAIIVNSPIYVSDAPLDLEMVGQLLEREQGEHGIKQALFDYDWLISAPGKDEIATSQNISRAMKQLAQRLDMTITLISSVNKSGMDTTVENIGTVSGSGKKLHDADTVYMLTKFNEKKNNDNSIMPSDYDRIVTLHFKKARELDRHIPGGALHFIRETPRPTFRELKTISPDKSPTG